VIVSVDDVFAFFENLQRLTIIFMNFTLSFGAPLVLLVSRKNFFSLTFCCSECRLLDSSGLAVFLLLHSADFACWSFLHYLLGFREDFG
jgi:hypothetical protein